MIRVGDFKIGQSERRAIKEVLDSGKITEGVKTKQFEEAWAKYLGSKFCVLVNSGTSALICALMALRIKNKYFDGVVTSPISFIATTNAITLAGLNPVFVDIDMETFGINPTLANQAGPDVCLPVHLMGYPVDVELLKHMFVIEDACQAHGTTLRGRKVGTFGKMGVFSFYIAHNVQAGEMGAVVTDDQELYQLIRQIKAHGRECVCPVCHRETCPHKDHDPRFTHTLIGYNFKTMDFNAALGLVQLGNIEKNIKARQKNVLALNKGLKDIKRLKTPKFDENVSYLGYPLLLLEGNRWNLCKELEKRGIETRPMFGCIPTQQPFYARLKQQYQGKLPNADFVGSQGFYLGCHQYLTTVQLKYIISTLKEIL